MAGDRRSQAGRTPAPVRVGDRGGARFEGNQSGQEDRRAPEAKRASDLLELSARQGRETRSVRCVIPMSAAARSLCSHGQPGPLRGFAARPAPRRRVTKKSQVRGTGRPARCAEPRRETSASARHLMHVLTSHPSVI